MCSPCTRGPAGRVAPAPPLVSAEVIDLVTESVAAAAVGTQGLTISVLTAAEVDLALCGEPLAPTQFSLALTGGPHGYVMCGSERPVLSW